MSEERFDVVVFQDANGTRYIYSDAAISAISGPSTEDVIIATFSNVERERAEAAEARCAEYELYLEQHPRNLMNEWRTSEAKLEAVRELPQHDWVDELEALLEPQESLRIK